MTDDDRPMNPELLAGIRAIVASNPDGQCATWRALRDVLRAHDQHAKRAHDLANRVQALEFQKLVDDKAREELHSERNVFESMLAECRKLLASERDSAAHVAAGFEQAKAERDKALRELLAPTGPRYSAANIALDPDETGESD